jgi:hypothetical protein
VFSIDGADAFTDVLCEIADPLELICDSQDSNHLPQIDSHRLAPRNRLYGPFLDCALHGIDRRIGGDHLPPAFLVAIAQRPDRLHDLSFDQATHFRDRARETLQLGVECRRRVFKNSHENDFRSLRPGKPQICARPLFL